MSLRLKAGILSIIHFIAAAAIYRYLITGGWLTNHYHLNDPNIVNLGLALFEPVAILVVISYWIWRTLLLYRFVFVLGGIQILIGFGFLLFVLLFALTWHPKLM
jgi:hypothetical protein